MAAILHVDETPVRLFRGGKGYVWVFANMDTVYYMYRESRKADFLKELLRDFRGVLITDFYGGYDSVGCRQQKCLIHLILDMNDDLLGNPFDKELRDVADRFGAILRPIIETVDRRGLKARFLKRHRRAATAFIEVVTRAEYRSDIARKYQKRIVKYGERLFTFLEWDGVPWNNNNAEHAIKKFAKYRKCSNGRFTEKSLRDYLLMLTVFQTCEYRNVDGLAFLLSGDDTVPE